MGKLYWYKSGKLYLSSNMLYTESKQEFVDINWKDFSGAQLNRVYGMTSVSPFVFASGTLKASSDTLENANYDDYNYNEELEISINSSRRYYKIDDNGIVTAINQITLTNNSPTESKTIGCIKKIASLNTFYNNAINTRPAQIWAYFFNEPIVIGPKQSFVFDLAISYETAMDSPEV